MILYRIELSYACFGIEVINYFVVDAAPIGKWMLGKHIDYIYRWVKRKGGFIDKIK